MAYRKGERRQQGEWMNCSSCGKFLRESNLIPTKKGFKCENCLTEQDIKN